MGIEPRSKCTRFVKDLMDKGRCVSDVLWRSRLNSEFGRETWSIDVSDVLYKSKRINCVRFEKASLEMMEMGLLNR